MKWFGDCSSLDQVKALYKKLAKEHHPDFGGSTEVMQQVNCEYALASAKVINKTGMDESATEREMRFSEAYRVVIEQVIHLDGLHIELVGHWIWVTGNTKAHRAALKAAGYRFASKKLAWYFRTDEFRVRKGGKKSLEQIKSKYGSEVVSVFSGAKKIV